MPQDAALDTAIVAEITESPILVHRWALAAETVGFDGASYATGSLLAVEPGSDSMTGGDPTVVTFEPPAGTDWRADPGPLPVHLRWLVRPTGTLEWEEIHAVRGRLSGLRRDSDGRYSAEIEGIAAGFGDHTPRRWSNEDQQAVYPGDRGFEFAAVLADEGLSVPWPPEQGYGTPIGPRAVPRPTVPAQVSDSPGRVVVFGGVTNVAVPGNITVTLFDNDQPLRNIEWVWERRDDSTDNSPETVSGPTSADGDRATYATQTADAGRQVRATASYDDAGGTGRTAASPWVSVVTGGGGGNGNDNGDGNGDN